MKYKGGVGRRICRSSGFFSFLGTVPSWFFSKASLSTTIRGGWSRSRQLWFLPVGSVICCAESGDRGDGVRFPCIMTPLVDYGRFSPTKYSGSWIDRRRGGGSLASCARRRIGGRIGLSSSSPFFLSFSLPPPSFYFFAPLLKRNYSNYFLFFFSCLL